MWEEERQEQKTGGDELIWQVVAFTLGEQLFAVNVNKTREILRWQSIRPLPESHRALLGVATIRGEVIPVIDLGGFLGIESEVPKEDKKLIVTEFEGTKAGFAVDGVRRIFNITSSQLDSTLTGSFMSENLLYVIKMEEENILMLDFERILQAVNPSLSRRMAAGRGTVEAITRSVGDASSYRILLAEDSPLMAEMIKGALEEGGFTRFDSVPDGKKALTRLLAAEEDGRPYHLLVSDVEMPVMDGLTLVRNLRSDSKLQRLPVVMFSSILTETMRKKAKEAGSNAEVSKPEIDTLLERVCQLLVN